MQRIYFPIKSHPNYEIEMFDGIVRNVETGKMLKPRKHVNGYRTVGLYANGKMTNMLVHRLVAMTFIPNRENLPFVDHINNIKTDNGTDNLRWCTSQQNNQNTLVSSTNTSGIKGVTYDKSRDKWRAQIKIDGIGINLGRFDSIEDAKKARQDKANEVFGKFTNKCEQLSFIS